jgi:hypothetical protein
MLQRLITQFGTMLVLTFCLPGLGIAQSAATAALVRQTLQAHRGAGNLPADLTIQGQVTDKSGTRPLRIQIKGADKVRYELGSGTRTVVSIFNGRSGWTGSPTTLKALPEHAATHRAAQIPFLDVITEIGNARFKAFDRGLERVGQSTLRHIAIRVNDPKPQQRFLNRALNEEVEIFIDPGTNLIIRSQRMLAADNSMDFRVPSILDFSDYRVVNGLVIPFRIANTVGTVHSGMYPSTWVIQSVAVNQGIADSVFEPR